MVGWNVFLLLLNCSAWPCLTSFAKNKSHLCRKSCGVILGGYHLWRPRKFRIFKGSQYYIMVMYQQKACLSLAWYTTLVASQFYTIWKPKWWKYQGKLHPSLNHRHSFSERIVTFQSSSWSNYRCIESWNGATYSIHNAVFHSIWPHIDSERWNVGRTIWFSLLSTVARWLKPKF